MSQNGGINEENKKMSLLKSICRSLHTKNHKNYYSAIKMNEILPFAITLMDLEGTMPSEISQGQILYDLSYNVEPKYIYIYIYIYTYI